MCTAVSLIQRGGLYFGRTLDLDRSFGEQVAVTPRNHPLTFRLAGERKRHHALVGMALMAEGCPLYYEAANEAGLVMAGLNFPGNAAYLPPAEGKDNIAPFELIPWVLGQCDTADQAWQLLEGCNVTDLAFRPDLPPAPLHWLVADGTGCLAAEPMAEGLRLYDNPVGVLTNNPPFPFQMHHLALHLNLTREEPVNRFAPGLELTPDCLGMGAVGLPGDLSSPSRFVRAAFARGNALPGETEAERVGQCFHLMDTVAQTSGLARAGEDGFERTVYTCCYSAPARTYCYTTYGNRRITAVALEDCDLEGDVPVCFPLRGREDIFRENGQG